jgi:hypothetical protein
VLQERLDEVKAVKDQPLKEAKGRYSTDLYWEGETQSHRFSSHTGHNLPHGAIAKREMQSFRPRVTLLGSLRWRWWLEGDIELLETG